MNSTVLIKRAITLLIAQVLICGLIEARPQESSNAFTGNWVGGIEMGSDWQLITVSFTGKETVAGQLSVPLQGFNGKFASVQIEGSHVRCELSERGVKLLLDGTIIHDEIEGVAEGSGRKGRFRLIRSARIEPSTLASYVGAYRFQSGRELVVDSFPEIPNTLLATDIRTGVVRAWFPVSETGFTSGPALFQPYPTEQVISFRKRGSEVIGLDRKSSLRAAEHATRIATRREEVRFKNGDVTLAGTLLLPAVKGGRPVPAVVFTHGGGAALREWFWGLGYLYAAHGIAVLAYDKRGVGDSSGNWREASFTDLADDAVAAARFLQSRSEIDNKKIGFWGLSQGGWIAPLAAARFKDSAFAIALSGGGLSPAEQELFDTEYELQMAGMSQGEVKDALSFQALKNRFMQTGEKWEEYEAARQQAKDKKWFRFPGTDIWGPASRDDAFWASMRRFYFYDPAQTLRALKCPLLAIFGELDTPKGVKANFAALEKTLAGHRDYTVKVYPLGRHNLMEVESGSKPQEFARLKRFVPGLFETLLDWVVQRVKPGGRSYHLKS
jgi:pimeloyl-ACP methyl ester carboxylesterase